MLNLYIKPHSAEAQPQQHVDDDEGDEELSPMEHFMYLSRLRHVHNIQVELKKLRKKNRVRKLLSTVI